MVQRKGIIIVEVWKGDGVMRRKNGWTMKGKNILMKCDILGVIEFFSHWIVHYISLLSLRITHEDIRRGSWLEFVRMSL